MLRPGAKRMRSTCFPSYPRLDESSRVSEKRRPDQQSASPSCRRLPLWLDDSEDREEFARSLAMGCCCWESLTCRPLRATEALQIPSASTCWPCDVPALAVRQQQKSYPGPLSRLTGLLTGSDETSARKWRRALPGQRGRHRLAIRRTERPGWSPRRSSHGRLALGLEAGRDGATALPWLGLIIRRLLIWQVETLAGSESALVAFLDGAPLAKLTCEHERSVEEADQSVKRLRPSSTFGWAARYKSRPRTAGKGCPGSLPWFYPAPPG